ncbi:MAG: hypothetical protein U1F43_19240 [Myxococcota bacterium]
MTYAGLMDSKGAVCRSMAEAHRAVDLAGRLRRPHRGRRRRPERRGIAEADINAAAPALLGMKDDIVEQDQVADPTKANCSQR